MKILSPRLHGYLDFVVVAAFALAPTLFGFMNSQVTMLCYALAGIHLSLTLLTDFPYGFIRKIIPMQIHGWIELVVAPSLIAMPRFLGFFAGETPNATMFFTVSGVVVFGVWLVTDYRGRERASSSVRRAA